MIDAITVTNAHIFTGARDSIVNVLDKSYNVKFTIDCSLFKNSINTQVRSITLNEK